MPEKTLLEMLKDIKIIDLTVMLGAEYPTSPIWGVPFVKAPFNFFTSPQTDMRGPYFDNVLMFEEHSGTHFDSPAHGIPNPDSGLPNAEEIGRVTVEKVDVAQQMGAANVIDCTALIGKAALGESPIITADWVRQWEEKNGNIEANEVVLFYTSWTDLHYKPFPAGYGLDRDCKLYKQSPGWPAPDAECITYLADKGVRHVGVDTVSLGPIQDDATPHRAGFLRGMTYTEKLCNLGMLPAKGSYFIFLSMKVEGGSAAPGRAIAIMQC